MQVGYEKIAIFDQYFALCRKCYKLLRNVNKNSYAIYFFAIFVVRCNVSVEYFIFSS